MQADSNSREKRRWGLLALAVGSLVFLILGFLAFAAWRDYRNIKLALPQPPSVLWASDAIAFPLFQPPPKTIDDARERHIPVLQGKFISHHPNFSTADNKSHETSYILVMDENVIEQHKHKTMFDALFDCTESTNSLCAPAYYKFIPFTQVPGKTQRIVQGTMLLSNTNKGKTGLFVGVAPLVAIHQHVFHKSWRWRWYTDILHRHPNADIHPIKLKTLVSAFAANATIFSSMSSSTEYVFLDEKNRPRWVVSEPATKKETTYVTAIETETGRLFFVPETIHRTLPESFLVDSVVFDTLVVSDGESSSAGIDADKVHFSESVSIAERKKIDEKRHHAEQYTTAFYDSKELEMIRLEKPKRRPGDRVEHIAKLYQKDMKDFRSHCNKLEEAEFEKNLKKYTDRHVWSRDHARSIFKADQEQAPDSVLRQDMNKEADDDHEAAALGPTTAASMWEDDHVRAVDIAYRDRYSAADRSRAKTI